MIARADPPEESGTLVRESGPNIWICAEVEGADPTAAVAEPTVLGALMGGAGCGNSAVGGKRLPKRDEAARCPCCCAEGAREGGKDPADCKSGCGGRCCSSYVPGFACWGGACAAPDANAPAV